MRLTVYLRPAVILGVRQLAERNRRPVSTQVEMLLERALEQEVAA